ncbi:MAG TPA: GNAT family N-acetyltransferase [Candidatus Binataceae bacterium]|nr:GNAT family N-acetyltransferase [Candidatus Binataceae bacterium]
MNSARASAIALNYQAGAARAENSPVRRLQVRPIAESRDAWQQFLTNAPQASLYHGFEWQQVLSTAYSLRFEVAILEKGRTPIAGCLLARCRNPLSHRLIALPFTDYCPPLALGDDGSTAILLRELASRRTAGAGVEIRGISAEPPWRTSDCFSHWTMDLGRPFSTIDKSMDRNFKRQVRRANEAELTVTAGSSLAHAKRFYALHLETRQRLGLPAPPWRFFRLVQETFAASGRFEVYLATLGERDVAGVVLLKDGSRLHCKWSARSAAPPTGATHLLFWNVCRRYAEELDTFDLGRTDFRNEGLARFKRELGAIASPLPYAFYPKIPSQVSAEHTTGFANIVTRLWRRLPAPVTRTLGAALYGYLS